MSGTGNQEDSAKGRLLLIYIARFIRAFGFGAVSVVFALFLLQRGFSSLEIGSLVSATLVEDAVVTAVVSIYAVQIGLRWMLLGASVLLILSGLLFTFCTMKWAIVLTAVFGIVSPAGYEGGPFGALEQAVISENATTDRLAHEFSVYNLIAFAGSALGSLLAGVFFPILKNSFSEQNAYAGIFAVYALGGLLILFLYALLDVPKTVSESQNDQNLAGMAELRRDQDPPSQPAPTVVLPGKSIFGISLPSSPVIWRLSIFQGIDAFGGGFVPATLISYWFFERYHAGPEFTGPVFSLTYALAALSFVLAPYVCKRFGLLNTMVFTHLPCSMSLCLIPFMPTALAAGAILVARSLFSSMDIPARQAYSMVLVAKEERSAVAGLTSASRSLGQCAAPLISGWALANTLSGLSFQIAGGLKTFYDIAVYLSFRNVPLHQEKSSQEKTAI